MQHKNSTSSNRPKSGDGTQDVRQKQDANWYGASGEPQEEFTNDHSGEGGQQHGPVSAAEPEPARTSEGSPFDADSGRKLLTPERADESRKRDSNEREPTDIDNRH